MYNLDKEKLKSIIENSSFSGDSDKNKLIRNAFLSFFTELCDYSEKVNNTIVNQSAKPDTKAVLSDISVVLMDRIDGEKMGDSIGLSRMTEASGVVFLNTDYESIKEIVGDTEGRKKYIGEYIKDGRAVPFEYSFRFNRSYVERQELLYKYAHHYNIINPITNPVVYSPYSFKTFDVVFDKEIADEQLDFQYQKNGLKVISSEDKDLFWNISVQEQNKTYDAKIPYGDFNRYIFEFKKSKKGNYLLPLPKNNQTKIYDIKFDSDCIQMTTDHDMDDFYLLELLEMDESSGIIKALVSNEMLFTNKNLYKGIVNGRLVSEADIEHVLSPFRDNYGIKCSISDGQGEIVKRYSQKYRPDRNDRKLFNIISREYISFVNEKETLFLLDYINYVLEYLEYYYPEIEWVGEI